MKIQLIIALLLWWAGFVICAQGNPARLPMAEADCVLLLAVKNVEMSEEKETEPGLIGVAANVEFIVMDVLKGDCGLTRDDVVKSAVVQQMTILGISTGLTPWSYCTLEKGATVVAYFVLGGITKAVRMETAFFVRNIDRDEAEVVMDEWKFLRNFLESSHEDQCELVGLKPRIRNKRIDWDLAQYIGELYLLESQRVNGTPPSIEDFVVAQSDLTWNAWGALRHSVNSAYLITKNPVQLGELISVTCKGLEKHMTESKADDRPALVAALRGLDKHSAAVREELDKGDEKSKRWEAAREKLLQLGDSLATKELMRSIGTKK